LSNDDLLAAELIDLLLYSVGHSNIGTLLQVWPVGEISLASSMAKSAADEAMVPDYDPETRVSLNKSVDQLPSVFNGAVWFMYIGGISSKLYFIFL
nr:hypothetical protein [Tanacetum cinerariifolium]